MQKGTIQGHELSGFWADLDGNGDSHDFASSLSIKSKGLFLTSSLMTGNEPLYKSMCSSVQHDIKGLNSQDLHSLLSDEFAPMALSEMTARASRDFKELGIYNTSLQSIAGSITFTDSLATIKNDIVSSDWVDKHDKSLPLRAWSAHRSANLLM